MVSTRGGCGLRARGGGGHCTFPARRPTVWYSYETLDFLPSVFSKTMGYEYRLEGEGEPKGSSLSLLLNGPLRKLFYLFSSFYFRNFFLLHRGEKIASLFSSFYIFRRFSDVTSVSKQRLAWLINHRLIRREKLWIKLHEKFIQNYLLMNFSGLYIKHEGLINHQPRGIMTIHHSRFRFFLKSHSGPGERRIYYTRSGAVNSIFSFEQI